MPQLTVSRVDGPVATFNTDDFLRVFRGTATSRDGGPIPWATSVTVKGLETPIHTNESIDYILQELSGIEKIAHFIGGDGTGVWVNAAKVLGIRPVEPDDIIPIQDPLVPPPTGIQTVFTLGKFQQMVRNSPVDVQTEITRVLQS
jgi:hypothetical protein